MSSPISPALGAQATGHALSARDTRRGAPRTTAASASQPPVSVETFPSSPPPEVLEQIAAAGRAYDQLSAQGLEVRFGNDPTSVELHDAAGNVSALSVSEAIDIAAGGAPPS